MSEKLLTVAQVAAELDCSKRAVHDELRRKNLRGSKLKVGWRISEADLETYVEAHANVPKVRRSA